MWRSNTMEYSTPVAFFGGEEGFRARQALDARKRKCLAREGVILVEWPFDTAINSVELNRALALIQGRKS